ncbi:MAG: hypothetical protein QE285_11520 [Aquabacterium sp.]|nr:hypothetical protein [Aquabacterium sp.]
MASNDHDDDPTRALDDFVQRMRQPSTPPAAPPDINLPGARPSPGSGGARPRGGVLRSGQRWDADDVEDVPNVDLPHQRPTGTGNPEVALPPVDLQAEQMLAALPPDIDLPAVRQTPPPDAEALEAATSGARAFASSQWDQGAPGSNQPVWQPEPAALQLRPASHPRLLARWLPGAWAGALRLVFDAGTTFVNTATGPVVQTYPAHHLLLLWPPQATAGLVGRWPQQVQLLTGTAHQASLAALGLLPDDARLWLMPDTDDVDWALGADIAMHHMPALRGLQLQGLRAFLDAEREAAFVRLNDRYHQPAPGAPVEPRSKKPGN